MLSAFLFVERNHLVSMLCSLSTALRLLIVGAGFVMPDAAPGEFSR